jgi:hypothetical protein
MGNAPFGLFFLFMSGLTQFAKLYRKPRNSYMFRGSFNGA